MDYKKYLFAVLALISLNDAVKVNMHGRVNVGEEVLKVFSKYMRRNMVFGSDAKRRSKTPTHESDLTFLIIQSTYLCKGLSFCDGLLESFVNEYILVQTHSIETILKEALYSKELNNQKIRNNFIFEEELKKCLEVIRNMFKKIDSTIVENNDNFLWSEVLKKISVVLQKEAIRFATERIEGTPTDSIDFTKKVTEKIVIAAAIVERKYERKLCADYDICPKTYKCTQALHTILDKFKNMTDDNVKIFIRNVAEGISKTKFYSILSEVTTNELQIIFNDMAYSDSVPTREVLLSILRTVDERLKYIETKNYTLNGRDVELVNAILSDMDHAYSKRSVDPFYTFLTDFYKWLTSGSRSGPNIQTLIIDLTNQLNEQSDDLILKLKNEVRVFLEITVDPEK